MSNADVRITRSIYLAVLPEGPSLPSGKGKRRGAGSEGDKKAAKQADKPDEKPEARSPRRQPSGLTLTGFNSGSSPCRLPVGEYASLQTGAEGQIYYLEALPASQSPDAQQGPPPAGYALHKYDLKKRKDDTILARLNSYALSSNNKKIMYTTPTALFITYLGDKIEPGKDKVNVDAVEVRIEPRAEWNQMFEEVWRINRDYFYDPNMHGADWRAMREKYKVFLPDLACRSDLNRVLTWMCSELSVGHHRVGGGDFLYQPKSVPGGLLGADYSIENGRYRFKKVYGGLNWNPDLQSPLDGAGSQRRGRANTCWPSRAGTCVRPRTSTAFSRTRPPSWSKSRSGRTRMARALGPFRGADRQRICSSQSGLGRGQSAQSRAGDGRTSGLRLRAEYLDARAHILQALLFPPGVQRGDHR